MSDQPGGAALESLLAKMTADSIEAAGLDTKTLMLVRIAALVAVDAPPASYLMNLGTASELGLEDDDVRAVLMAVAPIVGTARTVGAVTKMMESLGLAVGIAQTG